jgi:tetratricopeptide (TPR) repeat protein
VFRRAGVFAGGCDLEALAAVAVAQAGSDPLTLAAELLDYSLITVTDGGDGEPRVGMLGTLREYALECLAEAGEEDDTRRRHAAHYAEVAERAREQLNGPGQLAALDRLEEENDNLRAALTWSLETDAGDAERAGLGLRLVQALVTFWHGHGHATEGRRWLQRAIELASPDAGAPLAMVTHGLGMMLAQQSELEAAASLFERSLAIWRESGDRGQEAKELNSLGITNGQLGKLEVARSQLEESAAISREIGSDLRLVTALTNLGLIETAAGNMDRATQVLTEALALDQKQGDLLGVTMDRHALTMVSLRAGHALQARDLVSSTLDFVASAENPEILATALEMAACIAAELGDDLQAARLVGAAESVRRTAGMPIIETDAAQIERFLAPARAAVGREAWDAELAAGQALTQQQALALLLTQAPGRER